MDMHRIRRARISCRSEEITAIPWGIREELILKSTQPLAIPYHYRVI